ncbi:MAG: class I SAM-dependent methyltransferase [Anaerolineales bacterium]|nr:class I SAM-dependent methyltransferase [Anaerolineales bacterium]
MTKKTTQCWCGNSDLLDYSPTYSHCAACDTLILKEWPFEDPTHVNDQGEIYGKDYFLKHLPESYGLPSLYERARQDLTGRTPYWLRALLKYRLPSAKVLELGSAHGGFVAFLCWAGYDATGLELSPWLTEFARETFGVPLLQGPLEDQNIEKSSLGVIAHMDVLEHLPDPVNTMKTAANFLSPNGLMLLQTPCFDPHKSYQDLLDSNHAFLIHFKELEHLYLFSKKSLQMLFFALGFEYVVFEPAIFSQYDMFAVVSREPLNPVPQEEQVAALQKTPSGRLILALLDMYDKAENLQHHADARLKIVEEQSAEIALLRSVAQERLDLIEKLHKEN